MLGRRITLLGAAMLVALTAANADANPLKLELEVSPRTGTLATRFTATFTVQVSGDIGPDRIWNPKMPDFRVVDRQVAPTSTVEYDSNGRPVMTTTEVRTYVLVPRASGRLTVGPARIRLDGDEHETSAIEIDVIDTGAGAATGVDPDPTAAGGVGAPGFRRPEIDGRPSEFLHVVVDKVDPYVGEQVTATWLLYSREEVLKFEPTPPRLDDLWSEKVYEPDRFFRYHTDEVNGQSYRVAIVSKRALFPTRAGKVEIEPFRGKVQTYYNSLADATEISSPTVPLAVKELPPGAPPAFDPTYVGQFTASASVDREELQAGESLTLTLEVAGVGAIRRTTPPDLQTGGFSFRTPRDFDETVDTSGPLVAGKRTYRYWTTPQQGGAQTVPPLKIAYFNPRSGSYEIAQTDPIPIMVKGDPAAVGVESGRENFIAPDIRLIRDGATISSVSLARAYRKPWYWLLVLIPVIGFAGVLAWDRIRRGREKDTARSRVRRARGKARKRFKVADIHLRGNRPAKFFGELAGAIHSHLEERVGEPLSSLTRDELRALLAERGFPEETIGRIDEELSNCDFARFTPAASGPGEMKDALARTQELLREIERTPVSPPGEGPTA